MQTVYFDHSATTPLSAAAKAKICEMLEVYGNPSSLHPKGVEAHLVLEIARKAVAKTLGVRGNPQAGQIIFTSSGSEADNLAIMGTAFAKERRRGGVIITTNSEHSGVENAMRALEARGYTVIRISTKGGVIDMEEYRAALAKKPFLVSFMAVNNESGAMYDIATAFAMAKAADPATVTHTDAVQAYLKCKLDPKSLFCDLVTVSGHKIGAPKGVGALYVSPEALKRRDIVPLIHGGGQEAGFRSGTENLLGIAAFAAAAEEGYENLSANIRIMKDLRAYAIQKLQALPVRINLPKEASAPHILNITLPDIRSETMLHELSTAGICVSQGSACSAHAKAPSGAMVAFGLSPAEVECGIRLSFGAENTKEEIDLFTSVLEGAIARLVRIHR